MFLLASTLGRTVRELEGMPASEFLEWKEYFNIQPFGPWRDNLHAAIIAQHVAPKANFAGMFYRYTPPDEDARKQRDAETIRFLNAKVKDDG